MPSEKEGQVGITPESFAEFAKAILRVKRGESPPAQLDRSRNIVICNKAGKCNNISCPHIGVHDIGDYCGGNLMCEVMGEPAECITAIQQIRMVCSKALLCPNKHCDERKPHNWNGKCLQGKCKIADGHVKCLLAKPERTRSENRERLARKIKI